jgi:Zn-dependent protease with chaperone function
MESMLMEFAARLVHWAALPVLLLAMPFLVSVLGFAVAKAGATSDQKRERWIEYRSWDRVIQIVLLIAWWLLWDFRGPLAVALPLGGATSSATLFEAGAAPFWCLPASAIFLNLLFSSYLSTAIMPRKRGIGLRIASAIGRIVSFAAPLFLSGAGIDELQKRNAWGFLYFAVAAVLWRVGAMLTLFAGGFRLNTLKSGETLGRARRIAHQMGVELRYVFMVPAGRGRLTNAYSMGDAIAVTDSLGQHLTRDQLEFTIAHEVAHCQRKHGQTMVRSGLLIFGTGAAVLFAIGPHAGPTRTLLQIFGLLAPFAAAEWVSRRCEYEADRLAVEFTEAPEPAIRALGNLARAADAPMKPNLIANLFEGHPCVIYRVQAIAQASGLSQERLNDILREAQIIQPKI